MFLRRCSKNTVKYDISDMLCCQSVANSGVLATLAFLVVAKTSQMPWILGLAEEKTLQIALFCSWCFMLVVISWGAVTVGQTKRSFPAPQGTT